MLRVSQVMESLKVSKTTKSNRVAKSQGADSVKNLTTKKRKNKGSARQKGKCRARRAAEIVELLRVKNIEKLAEGASL